MATSDSARVGALFQAHGAQVYRRALKLLGNRADAEEATQEIFVRVMRSGDAFRGDALASTWLYQIATNFCLNQLRDKKRQSALSAEHLAPASEAGAARSEDWVHFRALLKAADPQQAEAAIYVYVDGMSHDEAAEVLKVSRRTVGNLLERFTVWANTLEAK